VGKVCDQKKASMLRLKNRGEGCRKGDPEKRDLEKGYGGKREE